MTLLLSFFLGDKQARREKINARMELLKELVPGCSKVSNIFLASNFFYKFILLSFSKR